MFVRVYADGGSATQNHGHGSSTGVVGLCSSLAYALTARHAISDRFRTHTQKCVLVSMFRFPFFEFGFEFVIAVCNLKNLQHSMFVSNLMHAYRFYVAYIVAILKRDVVWYRHGSDRVTAVWRRCRCVAAIMSISEEAKFSDA